MLKIFGAYVQRLVGEETVPYKLRSECSGDIVSITEDETCKKYIQLNGKLVGEDAVPCKTMSDCSCNFTSYSDKRRHV